MDRGAWGATVHRVTKSQTQLKLLNTHTQTHTHQQLQYGLKSQTESQRWSDWLKINKTKVHLLTRNTLDTERHRKFESKIVEHEKGYTAQILIIKNLPLLNNKSRHQDKEYYWDREAVHNDKGNR